MEKKKAISGFKTIKLKRTACFGHCPIYNVQIHSNGEVNYWGEMFVEKAGGHLWKLEADSINALNEAIIKFDYFSIKARKPTRIMTCNPSCVTAITLEDGTKKKIDNYYGNDEYPKKLQRLEKVIDRIIGIDTYAGSGF